MIFVCGIHGVGKTFFCEKLSKRTKLPMFSASRLILDNKEKNFKNKQVDNIDINEEVLIDQINKLQSQYKNFILDGHLCLLDKQSKIERIRKEVFEQMNIHFLITLIDNPSVIKKRMYERDGIIWKESFVKKFQESEVNYTRYLSRKLNLDYCIMTNNSDDIKFGNSIILPIKEKYANMIFNGQKKYEFRKKICKRNIDKIYLYVTSPVKKIVGEVQVIGKYSMKKENLWNISYEFAGITQEEYDNYFKNDDRANAYKIGRTTKFNCPIDLKKMGIQHNIQSYVYINDQTLNIL